MIKSIVLALSTLLLLSCSAKSHQTSEPASQPARVPVLLENMDAQFLYLAAQEAVGKGEQALAIRFLTALVKKDPTSLGPRLELVGLLMQVGQAEYAKQAKIILSGLPESRLKAMTGEEKLNYDMMTAEVLMLNHEPEKARPVLESLITKHPKHIKIRLLMAQLLIQEKNYDKAHQVLKEGIKFSGAEELYQLDAQLYLQQGKYKQADKALAAWQKKYPENEVVVVQRSKLASRVGNASKAEALLKAFISKYQDTAIHSRSTLAAFYVQQNRLQDALAQYHKLKQLTGGAVEIWMSVGKIEYELGHYQQAMDAFSQAVEQLTPKDETEVMSDFKAEALFYLAASQEAAHQWQQAAVNYKKLTPDHSFYFDAQLRLVNIDISNKALDKAEKELRRLKEGYGQHLQLYEMFSTLRLLQKNYELLISETEKAVDMGFSRVLLFNRALAMESLKQFEAMEKTLEALLAKEPTNSEALNFYGYSLADRGVRLSDAERMLKKALKIKPDDGYYLDSLAWVYYKQKKYRLAVEVQLKATGIIANDAVMYEHLGDIYWQLGKQEKARESWNKALKLKHKQPQLIKQKIKAGL